MKRVALFFDRPYVDAHSCFIELAKHLAINGYEVDLYCIFNSYNQPPVFSDSKIRVLKFPASKFEKAEFWYRINFVKEFKYHAVFGTPFNGIFLAEKISKKFNIPFIYLADEIFNMSLDRHVFPNYAELKKHDREANKNASATIALGKERFEYQTKINNLPADHKYFVIPNAPAGRSEQLKSHYFRDIFNIDDDKPILLFIGSLNWTLAKKLYDVSVTCTDKPYHLIFHARSLGQMGTEAHPFIKISTDPVGSNMLNYIVSSADIGLVLYDNESVAEKENALTGGKIGTYLKNNLPIIAGNATELKQLEEKGVASFISSISAIDNAVKKIMAEKSVYKKNIEKVYAAEYDYSKFYEPLHTFLNELV